MLIRAEKPITKEQYERAQLNNGYIANQDMGDIFSQSELCGYGIMNAMGCVRYDEYTQKTTYVVLYTTSTCCD